VRTSAAFGTATSGPSSTLRTEQPDVSWRYYIGGLGQIEEEKVANGTYARSGQATPSQLYWAPVLSMKRFLG
jgi:hypothetical protein